MMAHSGPGLSNTNCSMEVHWRGLKAATLGSAGSSGGGYSQLRVQSNLTGLSRMRAENQLWKWRKRDN